jgi:cysteine-rich PDZ-binding protein
MNRRCTYYYSFTNINHNYLLSGEGKLQKVICPDVWKDGANNTLESGGRELNENRLVSSSRKPKAARFNPYSRRCKICKGAISQKGAFYCLTCAYQKGLYLIPQNTKN